MYAVVPQEATSICSCLLFSTSNLSARIRNLVGKKEETKNGNDDGDNNRNLYRNCLL